MILRKTTFALTFILSCGLMYAQSWAQNASPSAPIMTHVQQSSPQEFIQDLGNHAIVVAADKNLSAAQHTDKYRDLLREAFDLKTIGHFVIGRAWDAATPAQQQEYMQLFEKLVLKMYGDRLNFYEGETFHVKGMRQENDSDTIVNSEIDHADHSAPTNIDWRVRQKGDKFAIIDVVIEGVSQSVTQRQEYSSVIQGDGGKIDALLVLMRQRVQDGSPYSTN